MPTKPGAGGKPQAYGRGGRYAASSGGLPNGADPAPRAAARLERMKAVLGTHEVQQQANHRGEGLRMAMDGAKSPRIRVSIDVLEKVVVDGRFKTQHETGTSGGGFAPELRDGHEAAMFAVEGTRPIYGYVMTRSAGDTGNRQGQYGEVSVVLKPEVSARTTVTHGDSFDTYDPPAPVPFNDVERASAERLAMAASGLGYGKPSYVEAQIHGGVTLDDIDYIEVPAKFTTWNVEKGQYDTVTVASMQKMFPGLDVRAVDNDRAEYAHFTVLAVEALAARVLSP